MSLHSNKRTRAMRLGMAVTAIIVLSVLVSAHCARVVARSLPLQLVDIMPSPTPTPTPKEPVYVIKITDIVTNGKKSIQALSQEAKVIRASDSREEPAQLNMSLSAGDRVETGETTQLTILFEDVADPLLNNAEVILYPKTQTTVGSIWTWFGSIFCGVRGYFNSGTRSGTGGTGGTEFIVSVDGDHTDLTVLDGTVNALAIDVVIEGKADLKTITISNKDRARCRKTHTYEFTSPTNMPWLDLTPQKVTLKPGQSADVLPSVKLKEGETAPAPDKYQGDVIVTCLDCQTEKRCGFDPDPEKGSGSVVNTTSVPVEVTVRSGAVPVAKRELLGLTRLESKEAKSVLLNGIPLQEKIDESTDLLITASGNDLAPNILPNFDSPEERIQAFRKARSIAVITDEDLDSEETMANVYLDWGKAARAAQAYEKAEKGYEKMEKSVLSSKDKRIAAFRANYGESLRLSGNLTGAEAQVQAALQKDSESIRAWTADGNLYRDWANELLNPKQAAPVQDLAHRATDSAAAMVFLSKAEASYEKARALSRLPAQAISQKQKAVLLTNLGDFYSIKRDFAYREAASPEAISKLNEDALKAYSDAVTLDPSYVYALAGSAFASLNQANIAKLRGDKTASAKYAIVQTMFEKVRSMDPTYQPAYTGLGIVYEILDSRRNAETQFQLAAQLEPEVSGIFVKVPDVSRKPRLLAMKIFAEAGLVPVTKGDGEFVTAQDTAPGTVLRRGSKVILRLREGTKVFYKLSFKAASNVTGANTAGDNTGTSRPTDVPDARPSPQSTPVSASTPTDAFRAYYEANQKRDVEAVKSILSKGTMTMLEERAKRTNKTVDTILTDDIEWRSTAVPAETRIVRIDGDNATLEVRFGKAGLWLTRHFVKEDGGWKYVYPQ